MNQLLYFNENETLGGAMLPFWNLFGTNKTIKLEDQETGTKFEASQKSFKGKVGNVHIEAQMTTFHMQGGLMNTFSQMLDSFNPMKLFSNQSNMIEDQSEK